MLGYMGSQSADGHTWGLTNTLVSQICAFIYFAYFPLLWFISGNEKTLPLPESISSAVLKSKKEHH